MNLGVLAFFLTSTVAHRGSGVPITVELPRAGLATVVIEDLAGNRIRNLISETPLPAGKTELIWDGYDDGGRASVGGLDASSIGGRSLVKPGAYRVRGLIHDRLKLRYELSVNSPGTPPWKTADGSGAWLADHSPPADVLALPEGVLAPNGKGPARLLVCSSSGETGEEFVWLNDEGRRLYGMNTGFWGATHLTRDLGKNAVADYYAYAFMSGERDPDNNTIELRGLQSDGRFETVYRLRFPMAWKSGILPQFKTLQQEYGSDGVAVYDGTAVFSISKLRKLEFVDVRKRELIGEVVLPYEPRGLVADAKGRLFVVAAHAIHRYAMTPGQAVLGPDSKVVSTSLKDARRIALAPTGEMFVSDWGASHQIKVFDERGGLVRKIGKPGGSQLGLYDERRMGFPSGAAIDQRGRTWVAEAEQYPKRLSLWNPDGSFSRAWYGGPKYGGGGSIDPADPSRFYYVEAGTDGGGVEFSINWKDGTYKPKAIYWRPRMQPNLEPMMGHAPERAFVTHGHRYMVTSLNGPDRWNVDRGCGIWRLDSNHLARPVAMFGDAADLENNQWGWAMKNKAAICKLWAGKDPGRVLFAWTDSNGDGIAEPSEVQFVVSEKRSPEGESLEDVGLQPSVQPDLTVTTAYGLSIRPTGFDANGVPRYDLTRAKVVGDPNHLRSNLLGGGWTLSQQDGNTGIFGADTSGKRFWQYPVVSEQQSPAHTIPGEVIEPNRTLGPAVKPLKGEAGYLAAINGDTGCVFLITLDGLFLQTLGGDVRFTPLWRFKQAKRGMIIDGVSFSAEPFDPTMTQTDDGRILLVVGHEHSSITELEGLDTVKRLDFGEIQVTSDELGDTGNDSQGERAKVLAVPLKSDVIAMDSSPAAWQDASWATLDERAAATVAVGGGFLYAEYKTSDPHLLENSGGDFHTMFKHGGCLDLMIRSNLQASGGQTGVGDERLLVSMVGGKTVAVLYRPVVPNGSPSDQFEFASPIGRVTFDQVSDVSDQIRLVADGAGDYELAVPLSLLSLSPKPGDRLRADIGILRGNAGQTIQRLYWSNKRTQMVSDVPSEARLEPENWGTWKF